MGKARLAIATAITAACLIAPAAAQAVEPIVFVHGWSSSGSTWNTMANRFRADGWTSAQTVQWSYNTSQSNATTAQQLSTLVDQVRASTGSAKVDLISHSMGGLSTRYYVKNLGGAAKVDDFVSLAGANHGTNTAFLCFQTSCRQMWPGSSFLNSLNAGDETPGAVNYATWWSPCDEVINPDSSALLAGAVNNRTGCLFHSGVKDSSSVYPGVREFVR